MKNKIDKIISKNKKKIIGRHNHKDFKRLFKKLFKDYHVKVNIVPILQNVSIDITTIGGGYDSEKDRIELDFFVTENENNTIIIPESFWSEFKFKFSQLMQHELIHRQQSFSRDHLFDSKKYKVEKDEHGEREYLSDSDEIDAYSHDIALEIMKFYKKSSKFELFSKISRKKRLESLQIYNRAFKNTNWTQIYKKLMKKTYKWTEYYGF